MEVLANISTVQKIKRKAVRKGHMETFEDFVESALNRFQFLDEKNQENPKGEKEIKSELETLHADFKSDFKVLEMVVGLQTFLQKLLEFMVLFDRKSYLEENKFNPVIVQMFDPITSPRCYAIYCQK